MKLKTSGNEYRKIITYPTLFSCYSNIYNSVLSVSPSGTYPREHRLVDI